MIKKFIDGDQIECPTDPHIPSGGTPMAPARGRMLLAIPDLRPVTKLEGLLAKFFPVGK
jgi:hypothetical protein